MASANVKIYMETLAKTATNGNVTVEFAWLAQRMELYCQQCKQTLTAPSPTDETVDYAVQEFLKLHLHKAHATWCACEKCHPQPTAQEKAGPATAGYATYIMGTTLAFEKPGQVLKMEKIDSPYTDEDYGLTNLPKAAKTVAEPVIDKNDISAAIIKAKLAEFKKEYAAKSGDQANIAKIKSMQQDDLAKAKEQALAAKEILEFKAEQWSEAAEKFSIQAYKNKVAIAKLKADYAKQAKEKIYQYETYQQAAESLVEVKKDKPLKDKVGRKFR